MRSQTPRVATPRRPKSHRDCLPISGSFRFPPASTSPVPASANVKDTTTKSRVFTGTYKLTRTMKSAYTGGTLYTPTGHSDNEDIMKLNHLRVVLGSKSCPAPSPTTMTALCFWHIVRSRCSRNPILPSKTNGICSHYQEQPVSAGTSL